MNFKTYVKYAALGLGVIIAPTVSATVVSCGDYQMEATTGAGAVSCNQFGSNNIHFIDSNTTVEQVDGRNKTTLFSPVTDLTSLIFGITKNAQGDGNGFGSFTVDPSVWNNWDTIYIALKQGSTFGVFQLTSDVNSGKWKTSPGAGTDLSHYLAFSNDPKDPGHPVPEPSAYLMMLAGLLASAGYMLKNKQKTLMA